MHAIAVLACVCACSAKPAGHCAAPARLPRQPRPGLRPCRHLSRLAWVARGGRLQFVVQDTKLPCPYRARASSGARATSWTYVYHVAVDCPPPGHEHPAHEVFSPPAVADGALLPSYEWPVTGVSYGKPSKLAVPPPQVWHALVGEERTAFVRVPLCCMLLVFLSGEASRRHDSH